MRHRKTEIAVYSIAFMDVIFCALGGVLIITIQTLRMSHEANNTTRVQADLIARYGDDKVKLAERIVELETMIAKLEDQSRADKEELAKLTKQRDDLVKIKIAAEKELDRLKVELAKILKERDDLGSQLALANAKIRERESELAKLERQLALVNSKLIASDKELARLKLQIADMIKYSNKVLDLRGPMKNVVFVFDTSASMKLNEFDRTYKEVLKAWLGALRYEKFALLQFSTDVRSATGKGWKTQADLSEINQYIDQFRAEGHTNLRKALEQALAYPNVDTIILFSDGEPNLFGDDPTQPMKDSNQQWIKGQPAIDDLNRRLRGGGNPQKVVINTVGMGNYLNQTYGTFLQSLARDNRGRFVGLGVESEPKEQEGAERTPNE